MHYSLVKAANEERNVNGKYMPTPETICTYCHQEVDLTTCGCGSPMEDHGILDGHSAVPMGCDCLRIDDAEDLT